MGILPKRIPNNKNSMFSTMKIIPHILESNLLFLIIELIPKKIPTTGKMYEIDIKMLKKMNPAAWI